MRKLGRHIVDRAFEEQLSNATMPVSNRVWNQIGSELEKDRMRKQVMFYRWVAAASLALLLSAGAWMGIRSLLTPSLDGNAFAFSTQWCEPGSADHLGSSPSSFAALNPGEAKRPFLGHQLMGTLARGIDGKMGLLSRWIPEEHIVNKLLPSKRNAAPVGASIEMRSPVISQDFAMHAQRGTEAMGQVYAEAKQPRILKEREFEFALVEEPGLEKDTRKLELGAAFAPDMSFASTTPVQVGARTSTVILADDPTDANAKRLSPVMAYQTGLKASLDITDRLALRTGLSYIYRQSSTTEAVNSFGKVDAYQSSLDLSTLEIPVTMRLDVLDSKKLDYYVAGGVSGNFLLYYSNEQITSAGKVAARRTSDGADLLKPSAANLHLSTGISYNILDRLNLQVEPGIRYGAYTNDFAFTQSRPVSMNLSTGINYRF